MIQPKGTSHASQVPALKRVEGQVKGVIRMIEEERYCPEILQQLKAIKAAVARVERQVFDGHLNHCVRSAAMSKNESEKTQKLNEISELLKSLGV